MCACMYMSTSILEKLYVRRRVTQKRAVSRLPSALFPTVPWQHIITVLVAEHGRGARRGA